VLCSLLENLSEFGWGAAFQTYSLFLFKFIRQIYGLVQDRNFIITKMTIKTDSTQIKLPQCGMPGKVDGS
jgi:hypothetical protein